MMYYNMIIGSQGARASFPDPEGSVGFVGYVSCSMPSALCHRVLGCTGAP